MVVIGIPFAIATCVLIAIAALIFFGLCLLAALCAGALVFYTLKGLIVGTIAIFKFLKDPQARSQVLPSSTADKTARWNTYIAQLQQLSTANQVSAPPEPSGYIYPWYEGNPQAPERAHLSLGDSSQPPGPASTIPSASDNATKQASSMKDARISASSLGITPDSPDDTFYEALSTNFVPYCRLCHKAKLRTQFPSRNITSRCTHQPECCLICLSNSITRDIKDSAWQRICCPLCKQLLQYADVKEFGSRETFEEYLNLSQQHDEI